MSIETCIDQCQECQAEVAQAAVRLAGMGADTPAPVVAALLDCARVTETTADLLRRLPDLQGLTGRVCAEICERCAETCATFQDDSELADCAKACRACAEACRSLATDGTADPADTAAEEGGEDEGEAINAFGFIEAGMAELVRAEMPN